MRDESKVAVQPQEKYCSTIELEAALPTLNAYERFMLLAALRRDMQSERDKAGNEGDYWQAWHKTNWRMDLNLLQRLNPKHTRRKKHRDSHTLPLNFNPI